MRAKYLVCVSYVACWSMSWPRNLCYCIYTIPILQPSSKLKPVTFLNLHSVSPEDFNIPDTFWKSIGVCSSLANARWMLRPTSGATKPPRKKSSAPSTDVIEVIHLPPVKDSATAKNVGWSVKGRFEPIEPFALFITHSVHWVNTNNCIVAWLILTKSAGSHVIFQRTVNTIWHGRMLYNIMPKA